MGELIFFVTIPVLAFTCSTINYLIITKFKLPKYIMYLIPILSILLIFINEIKWYMILCFYFSCVYSTYSYYDS